MEHLQSFTIDNDIVRVLFSLALLVLLILFA
jgi:phage shock protein PspC (stress-responsive transcriptional regulator)